MPVSQFTARHMQLHLEFCASMACLSDFIDEFLVNYDISSNTVRARPHCLSFATGLSIFFNRRLMLVRHILFINSVGRFRKLKFLLNQPLIRKRSSFCNLSILLKIYRIYCRKKNSNQTNKNITVTLSRQKIVRK